jgi:hypothetical protein
MKKYVVLETLIGPSKGVWFWSTNSSDNTHSALGVLWYKEIAFTDNSDDAIKMYETHQVIGE